MKTTATITVETIRNAIESKTYRSAWDKGVTAYALGLLDTLTESINCGYFDPADLVSPSAVHNALLNGARDWTEYSYGGCALIFNGEIAERLCTPSEIAKTRFGDRMPNGRENWVDVQARALWQAERRIWQTIRELMQ